jgi:mono/diheme cytochrome c family protein
MKKTLLALIILLVLSSQSAVAQDGAQGPSTPPAPEIAASIYEARCLTCHGPTGQGDGARAVQASLAMPDLTDPALWRETTPARWFDIISNGVQDKAMPPFGEASSNPLRQIDRWNLVFYLYTLVTSPGQIEMGRALYEQNCAECHAAAGAGTDDAPGFTDLAAMANVSQADLYAAIADANIEGHDVELAEVEIWALADYVRTFSYNYTPPVTSEAPAAPATRSPFTGGVGVISGQVRNGTAGAAPPAGIEVRLRAFDMDATFVDAITTTTSADGSFRFEGIDPTAPVQLEPTATYYGVTYVGDLEEAIQLSPEQPTGEVDITVYETTEDDSAVRIERLHIVTDFAAGQVQIAELYILSNTGDRAYVGTLEQGTIRLSVPSDALSFQPGGDPNRYRTLADGIADTIPVPPGVSTAESVLVYNLAYDDGLELTRPLPYAAKIVNVFVPDVGVEVSGEGLRDGGPFNAQGTLLNTYLADDLAAGSQLTIKLSGEPELTTVSVSSPHEANKGPDDTQSMAIGLIVLAGAVAVGFLYWRGYLQLGARSAAPSGQTALLQAIADLDDEYAAGRLKKKPYQAERARLKAKLVELMKKE